MDKTDYHIHELQEITHDSELLELSYSFFNEYADKHEEFFKIDNLTDKDIINYFSSFLNSEEHRVFIAVKDEHIIGYIAVYIKEQPLYWRIKKVGDISGLMVRKEYRRNGVAKDLFNYAVEFFKKKGVKYFTVYTSVNNTVAIEFYKASGMYPLHSLLIGETSK